MRRFLSLMCAAACGAVVAMGLATRSLPLEARPVPEPTSVDAESSPPDVPAQAPFRARASRSGDREEGEVLLGNRVVVRLRSRLGDLSAYERALIAAHRLNGVASSARAPVHPKIEIDEGCAHVDAGGVRLVTVDEETARLNESSITHLAEAWRDSIAGAFGSLESAKAATQAEAPAGDASRPDGASSGASDAGRAKSGPPSQKTVASGLRWLSMGHAVWATLSWPLLVPVTQADAADPEEHPGLYRARPNYPEGREEGQVVRDGVIVLRVRAPLADLSPYERAIITAKRLNDFLANYGADGPLRVENDQGAMVVRGGAIKLATADAESARLLGTTADRLAEAWIEAIRRSLGSAPAALPDGGAPVEQPGPPLTPDTGGAPVVHLRSAETGERIGKAALAGDGANECVAVMVAESTYDDCARIRAFVPVADLPEPGEDLVRLDGCSVLAFTLASEAPDGAHAEASTTGPRGYPGARYVALQQRQGIADILETLGVREAVRQFAPELDEAACSLARAAGAPGQGPATAVVPAIDAALRTAGGGLQIGGAQDQVARARAALLYPDSGPHSLTAVTVSATPDPDAPEPLEGLEILAWIDFPRPAPPAASATA